MHVRASALLLWVCSSTIACSHVIPHGKRNYDDDDYAGGDYLARTWADDDDSISMRFASVCEGCFGSIDSSYIFNINISRTQSVCGETNVTLNQRKLDIEWDGSNGTGSGIFPANMTSGYQTHELSLSYLAFCVSSQEDFRAEYTAQILTVTFQPANQITNNDRTSGFAISFNSVGTPRIYRLVASPVEIFDEDSFDPRTDTLDPFNLPISSDKTASSDYILHDKLKSLHALKAEAQKLQEKIRFTEQEIRKHLLHDCTAMVVRLKECASLSCFISTSFEIVPDAFRLVKHQFGPLPFSLSDSPCRPAAHTEYQNPASQNTTPPPNNRNPNTLPDPQTTSPPIPPLPPPPSQPPSTPITDNHNLPPNYYDDLPNCHDLPDHHSRPDQGFPNCRYVLSGHDPNRHDRFNRQDIPPRNPFLVLKDATIILLLAAFVIILIKHYRNSPSWRRRRVDLAARREERRTRHAYIIAARRYRWRQWWTTRFGWGAGRDVEASSHRQHGHQQQLPQQQHMLMRDNEEYENGNNNSNNTTAGVGAGGAGGDGGGGAIQDEILGFRRVLEFVGELVRPADTNYISDSTTNSHAQVTGNTRHGNYQRDISQLPFPAAAAGSGSGRSSTPAPSSVAPLTTTVYSPRTSTVLSIETDSSLTLDSLDPDTATVFSG
ncbi:hypothetical protein ACJ72_00789 [Emergomyces africanus]|uniref:Uncharacterized protein n=1 Tax=Emergomyces africanus TaxID=1955775 RepID=A0A1B7P761_9EURO|nr:hypothetical protein ACJ72_00789 [Emergomyces africanus]